MLHGFAKFLAGCTVLLILAGSLVTSHAAGLSVPDWPTSYGWNMFTFPPSMWVANIFYEHVHRLVASSTGLLTILLVIALCISKRPRWLRWFGVAALGAVIAQGLLGGLTVLLLLPPAVSTAHAALAEIFFCLTVSIALFTSPGWNTASTPVDDERLRRLATMTTVLVFCQIIVGATMRHRGAGLAIPDFPLSFGHIVPDHWSTGIAFHFVHRIGAAVVACAAAMTAVDIRRRYRDRAELAVPALLLMLLVLLQVTLGASVVVSKLSPWVNSIHVVVGALVLATSLVIALRCWQAQFPRDVRNNAAGPVGR